MKTFDRQSRKKFFYVFQETFNGRIFGCQVTGLKTFKEFLVPTRSTRTDFKVK